MNPFVQSYLDYFTFSAVIENVQTSSDYTAYIIKVSSAPHQSLNGINWHITKRFSDFDKLNNELKIYDPNLPLPAKKLNKLSAEVIADRQTGLQNYLTILVENPLLCHSRFGADFLYPPSSGLGDFKVRAAQCVAMEFRNKDWAITEPLSNIGFRLSKNYFLVANKLPENQERKYCAVWHEFLHHDRSKSKELQKAIESIASIRHPFILPIMNSIYNEKGVVIIREFTQYGSLLDSVCLMKPHKSCLKKYGKLRRNLSVGGLNNNAIQTFGRQILEALHFLHGRGWHHGHLTTRNVIVTSLGTVALTDLENSLFDYQTMHRPYLIELKKTWTMQEIDMYCFGRCLLEMSIGEVFMKGFLNEVTASINPELMNVLQLLLDKESIKKGLPTANDLINHAFFSSIKLPTVDKPIWRITTSCRQYMNQHQELVVNHLKRDQQLLFTSRRRMRTESRLAEEKKQRVQGFRKQFSTASTITESRTWSGSPARQDSCNIPASSSSSSCVSIAPNSQTTNDKSISTTSVSSPPPPPPLPPPPPPPAPPLPPPASVTSSKSNPKSTTPASPPGGAAPVFLNSIVAFNKNSLKMSATRDRSRPLL